VPFGFSNGRISLFAEVGDNVFPLGQVCGRSDITNHTEFLLVAVDTMVAKGCDDLIVKLAQDLVAQGMWRILLAKRTTLGGRYLDEEDSGEDGAECMVR
jgi:hypothetical protein